MENEEQSTSVAIGTGKRMPILGFGTYLIRNDDCHFPVLQALKAGYRLIDTAEFYDNHEAIGRAVRGSGLAREDIFIKLERGSSFELTNWRFCCPLALQFTHTTLGTKHLQKLSLPLVLDAVTAVFTNPASATSEQC